MTIDEAQIMLKAKAKCIERIKNKTAKKEKKEKSKKYRKSIKK